MCNAGFQGACWEVSHKMAAEDHKTCCRSLALWSKCKYSRCYRQNAMLAVSFLSVCGPLLMLYSCLNCSLLCVQLCSRAFYCEEFLRQYTCWLLRSHSSQQPAKTLPEKHPQEPHPTRPPPFSTSFSAVGRRPVLASHSCLWVRRSHFSQLVLWWPLLEDVTIKLSGVESRASTWGAGRGAAPELLHPLVFSECPLVLTSAVAERPVGHFTLERTADHWPPSLSRSQPVSLCFTPDRKSVV